ncbi:hypothetical protein HPB50_029156 [Hyalomma asiaticum]|nr:hypothetical protein HPB50_029156 [Hyalomma asiaticum]
MAVIRDTTQRAAFSEEKWVFMIQFDVPTGFEYSDNRADLAAIFRICCSSSYWSWAGNPAAAAAKIASGAIGADRAVSADLAVAEQVSALLRPQDCSV